MRWQTEALVELVRTAYPGWSGFEHEAFASAEMAPLQKQTTQFDTLLNKTAFEALLQEQAYGEIFGRISRIGRNTSLLHTTNILQGDLNVLTAANSDAATFSHLFFDLIHGTNQLDRFTRECQQRGWPVKWAFVSYFLCLAQPDEAVFVKPRMTQWLLKFLGEHRVYTRVPTHGNYQKLGDIYQTLQDELAAFGAVDKIALYAFVATAYRAGRKRSGKLDAAAQIALDQPPTVYKPLNTDDELVILRDAPVEQSPLVETDDAHPMQVRRTLATISAETHFPLAQLQTWKTAIQRKKQAIFYGPPGTGKTFLAQQFAQHLIGDGNGFWELVQFHPAYAYEDFIQGLRPIEQSGSLSYELVAGRFLNFCQRATGRDTCVLVIDEINRADLARVFGELMYLLEYREASVELAAGGQFQIPNNVLIIGTMNTADRSVALIDHALRRRFAFLLLRPNYNILRNFHATTNFDVEPLISLLQQINLQLDSAQQLGGSFFLTPSLQDELHLIWQTEIEPYLEEQFYDQPALLRSFRWSTIAPQLAQSR